jgi:hypothetical protein
MPVDDAYVFAQLPQNTSHAEFATQRVAIGADMARKYKTLTGIDSGGQKIPI